MDAEAYVQGHEAIDPKDTPIHLQLHDVFFRLTDTGTTVRTAVTEANGVFVTKLTSTPAATTLTAGLGRSTSRTASTATTASSASAWTGCR